ncbi:Diacylglycerol kinase family enzyme [Prosthecobacter debontii]|uniref:Diacylglycerol kinase family enzyme n=1 Tax=Prosthecobacter debontii TaxID=48467 RepID=A0A1T4Z0P5_9BACT|nr:diacylglycerol kinase family protein [Prosthecobacter debontii]SKB07629.1 Diacylglycerol kinase family enzyme [Prosthecobacter debontii]
MDSPPRRKFSIILNRESGTLRRLGVESVEADLRQVLEGMGCEVEFHTVTGKQLKATLEKARDGTADAVVVGGGDGTVAAAANAFARHAKPLGLLPLGTFNLAARDVGMPLDLKEAAAALVTAPVTETDLLDVAGELYLCMVVMGFYPALAMAKEEYHGSWIVKSIRTFWTALSSVATFPPLYLCLQEGEQVLRYRTRIALMANNDYEDLFGIIPKRRSLNAGYFTVYVSTHSSQVGLMRSFFAWVQGRWKQDKELQSIHATDLEVRVTRKRRVPVMMDGEIKKIAVPFRIKLVPKALRVIAPRLLTETSAEE